MLPALSQNFGVRAFDLPYLLPAELDAYLSALSGGDADG